MDAGEICREITRLQSSDTTLRNCELLAVLYTAQKCLQEATREPVPRFPMYSAKSEPQGSEFVEAALNADYRGVLNVLDEHMEAIRVLYPKEYAAVMRKIRNL